MSDGTLTPEEIAEYLRVQTQTVWRMIRRGELPAIRVGRAYRIKREDFDSWCTENRVSGPETADAGAAPEGTKDGGST